MSYIVQVTDEDQGYDDTVEFGVFRSETAAEVFANKVSDVIADVLNGDGYDLNEAEAEGRASQIGVNVVRVRPASTKAHIKWMLEQGRIL